MIGTTRVSGGTITSSTAIKNTGVLYIEGTAQIEGSLYNGDLGGSSYSGVTYITGGTITVTAGNAIDNNRDSKIIMSGGTIISTSGSYNYAIDNEDGNVSISGGKISVTNPSVVNNDSGTVTISGTVEIEKTSGTTGPVIYNSYYADLTISGGKITSTGYGVDNVGNLEISGTVEITTSGSMPGLYNKSSGTITIKGGTVTSNSTSRATIENYSSEAIVTITGGTITSTGYNTILNSGKLEVSGGTVKGTASSKATLYNNGVINISGTAKISSGDGVTIYNKTGEIDISGGTITVGDSNAINNFATLKIRGGTLTSNTTYPTVYNQSSGNLAISGGTIRNSMSGKYAVYNDGGTATVTGGTISKKNF